MSTLIYSLVFILEFSSASLPDEFVIVDQEATQELGLSEAELSELIGSETLTIFREDIDSKTIDEIQTAHGCYWRRGIYTCSRRPYYAPPLNSYIPPFRPPVVIVPVPQVRVWVCDAVNTYTGAAFWGKDISIPVAEAKAVDACVWGTGGPCRPIGRCR